MWRIAAIPALVFMAGIAIFRLVEREPTWKTKSIANSEYRPPYGI